MSQNWSNYNLVDRCLLLSYPQFFNKNLEVVIDILISNGYPLDLIFNKINHRIGYLIAKKSITERQTNIERTENTIKELETKKLFVIPYINRISEMIVSSIRNTDFLIG